MLSPVVNGIVRQEMENEAEELEKKIADMEFALQQASMPSAHKSLHSMSDSYNHWNSYQDTEELESKVEAAKSQLTRLKDRISRLSSDNPKACSHRFACGCSQNKQAEREVVAMSASKRLEEMQSFKEQGNALFGEKKYREALALYEKSLVYFEYCFDGAASERKDADAVRLCCLLNAGESLWRPKS